MATVKDVPEIGEMMAESLQTEGCCVLIACPDAPGIIAAVSGLVATVGGNIIDADQHTERALKHDQADRFFMRVVAEVPIASRDGFEEGLNELESRYSMLTERYWDLADRSGRGSGERVVVLSGPESHCLSDLLFRWRQRELGGELVGVVSNHEDGRQLSELGGVPFVHLPVVDGDRAAQEQNLERTLANLKPGLIVLARYMLVLPGWLVEQYAGRMINIHHGFLPAFAGARPYHQAHDRGVKLIGATSHYVTEVLDDGPIISQETAPITHRDDVPSMKRLGRDLERMVLARAVRLHLERRVLVEGRRTVVFE